MTAKHFLFTLKHKINTKYPDLQPEFYVAKRSKSIHNGLNCCLLSVTNNQEIISDIYEHFQSKDCRSVSPILINTTKWKFDYIFLKKNIRLFLFRLQSIKF